MRTRGTTLVEAAPRDTIWGIGLSANNWKAQYRKHWRGIIRLWTTAVPCSSCFPQQVEIF